MNAERYPLLRTLFVEAEEDLTDADYTVAVMTRIRNRRRQAIAGRLAIAALLIALELSLSYPLQTTVGALTDALATPLVELEGGRMAVVLAPVNSVAGLIGMLLLGMQFLFRRLVR